MTGQATGFTQKLLSAAEPSQPLTAALRFRLPLKPIKAWTQQLKFRDRRGSDNMRRPVLSSGTSCGTEP
jgi:hypothetical protein